MKKIMFSERFGLEQAVLAGTKTQTRRIVPEGIMRMARMEVNIHGGDIAERIKDHAPLCYLEVIAIAQPYKDICLTDPIFFEGMRKETGWGNKMFVKGRYMPHRIRITGIKLERLRDISEEDIMREGIMEGEFMNTWDKYYFDEWGDVPNHITFRTPRAAFAALIDKINGTGTWNSNPLVYVYTFELVQ